MATSIGTYDTHADRKCQTFYDGVAKHKGERLAESVWGIELSNTPSEVREWVKGLLDDDDKIVVIQVKPTPSWATRKATKIANDWLKGNV